MDITHMKYLNYKLSQLELNANEVIYVRYCGLEHLMVYYREVLQ